MLALVVIAVQPGAAHWAVVLLPLLVFSLWCSWRPADRSLPNDGVTVLAACLMTVVAAGFGQRIGKPGTPTLTALAPLHERVGSWVTERASTTSARQPAPPGTTGRALRRGQR